MSSETLPGALEASVSEFTGTANYVQEWPFL
jgi:hypothetical protein